MSEKTKPVDCEHCEHFDGEDCSIIVETDDFEKCLKPTEDGLGYEFCPLYGGYPKEEQA
jgi:hypothetical protein